MRAGARSLALRSVAVTALFGLLSFHARLARADEKSSIELAYLADGTCPDESAFRAYMEAVGVAPPADPRAPTRFFTVLLKDRRAEAASSAAPGDGKSFTGELIWVDGVERTASRTIAGSTCEGVARALSLLVAFVLDTPLRTVVVEEAVGPKGAPAGDGDRSPPSAPEAPVAPGGGLTVATFYGGAFGRSTVGLRTLAATDISVATVGGTLTLQSDEIDFMDPYGLHTTVSGYSGRVGVFSAWGAPWDDSVAGLMLEAGVTAGTARGSVTRTDRSRSFGSTGPASAVSTQFANPYGGVSLMFQIPLDWRVRPFVGTSVCWIPGFYVGSTFTFDGQVGLRFAAW